MRKLFFVVNGGKVGSKSNKIKQMTLQMPEDFEQARPLTLELDDSDPIASAFPPSMKLEYEHRFTPAQRQALVRWYKNTPRWTNNGGSCVYPPSFQENDLDHVVKILHWINFCEQRYPKLMDEVSGSNYHRLNDMRAMIAMHDVGETVVQDITADYPDKEAKRKHKEKEERAAMKVIGGIRNSAVRDTIRGLFIRFESKAPDDKVVQFGHLLDKADAARMVSSVVIPYNLEQNFGRYVKDLESEIRRSIGYVMPFADNLATQISDDARVELGRLLEEELLNLFDRIDDSRVPEIMERVRGEHSFLDNRYAAE